ncbi:MAG: hypothetical protein GY822_28730, partial [Deltaproteobacteria bacterium]|nr:hypothetical protein [Deltaproteobacteria bacterium]
MAAAADVLELWKQNPISAQQFAAVTPLEGLSKTEVENIVRASDEYGVLAQAPKTRRPHVPRRFIDSELRRGSLTFVDSAYFRHFFGAQFAMVHIDHFSKLVQYEPVWALTGIAAANAFSKILQRLPYPRIKKLVSDRGTEYTSSQ